MIKEIQLRLLPQQAASEQVIAQYISKSRGIDLNSIKAVHTLKRSIDARQKTIYVNISVRAYINEIPDDDEFKRITYPNVEEKERVIVVGAGPAGLFAALRLIELGICPIIIERGKNVHDRKKDIALISRNQTVNSESNYCFGEGGAGAYSDGKLYTRSKKRGSVNRILHILCQHGASISILSDAHPHIGTDKLPSIIENIRNQIISAGGEVHFDTRMDKLIIKNGEIIGIETHKGKIYTGKVILATGHSARDVYYHLYNSGIPIEAKGIAVGVRLEHPQDLIDQIQYHNPNGRGKYLPAAEYNFVTQIGGRGVYSFCMCPGGFIVPAASGPEQIVVNGMSPSHRGSKWANSGMVVEIKPEDIPDYSIHGNLAVMKFQEELERLCYVNGNCKQTAPAQRMTDFVTRKGSFDLPETSYTPGVIASPLHFWMPEFITTRLQEGFKYFGKISKGFLTREALMIGVESRTSSPIRIPRDKEKLEHITIKGLYPCGEGAGYAGGIVSAAIDGERCAEALAASLSK
ncbi:NAD(P)/FAD-dependent oxidoreductase [Coprobacter tertius]|uniref:NAD(P)/FAD-dependent oxidoreductase n=1 Tax=Coprobacter tertius TaxID=2944915 RepID=A0ABT1MHV3_9BACT|nr:NAD(P)/FAD-dependent oxidoreductase [Coprobacter tertius]MCP9612207.1 NAD(P)/FAD-dependent oxidoreductase [Coprobacter tertius]